MSTRLLELYKSILATCWMTTDAAGNVYNNAIGADEDDKKTLTSVDGKFLVLPTREQLAKGDPDRKIVFHPLSEMAMKGESLVVTKLRRAAAVRINWIISNIVVSLVQVGASHAEHEKLSPSQSGILSILKEADERTIQDVKKMVSTATSGNFAEAFYSLFLRRGAKIGGQTYGRGGIVMFPFYEELKKTQERYFGVQLRKKDRTAMLALFESIIPGIDNAENYCIGVDSTIAPFMEALMRTIARIGGELNAQVELYSNVIPVADKCLIESDWEEAFNHLGSYQADIKSVPPQAGNEGMDKRQDVLAAQQAIQPAPQATRSITSAPAPANPVAAALAPWEAAPPAGPVPYQPAQAAPARAGAASGRNYMEDLKRFQQQQQQPQAQPQYQPTYQQQYHQPAPQVDPWGRPVGPQFQPQQAYGGYYQNNGGYAGGGGSYGNNPGVGGIGGYGRGGL